MGILGRAGCVATEEVDVDLNFASCSLHEIAEVGVGVASKIVLPAETLRVSAIPIGKRNAETDLISIAFQIVELEVNINGVSVTWEFLFCVALYARSDDSFALLPPGPPALTVKTPSYVNRFGETHLN